MAIWVVSETMRCEPWTEMPMPPPITMPFIMATYGLGYSAIRLSMAYSVPKVSATSSERPSRAASRTSLMSPPAHRALGSVDCMTTCVMAGSLAQS